MLNLIGGTRKVFAEGRGIEKYQGSMIWGKVRTLWLKLTIFKKITITKYLLSTESLHISKRDK